MALSYVSFSVSNESFKVLPLSPARGCFGDAPGFDEMVVIVRT